jgi:hypothetical protein
MPSTEMCLCISGKNTGKKTQEAAEGRTAHNNGWNGANGMASNTWKPFVGCVLYHSTNTTPTITMKLSSPIKSHPPS